MDPIKTDLAKKFNDWYVYQVKNLEKNSLIYKDKKWGHIGNILSNIDKMNYNNGRFVYDDCIIHINRDINEYTSELKSYSGRIYYKGDTNFFPGLEINFDSDGWYYKNGETYYFNEKGPIDNVGVVLNDNRELEEVRTNGIYGRLPNSILKNSNSMEENSNKRKAVNDDDNDNVNEPQIEASTTTNKRYKNRGGRKSRKSRKNKKQKNRKTNRR